MKKFARIIGALVVFSLVFTLFACSKQNVDGPTKDTGAETKKVKIAVIQPLEHLSLNEIRDTIVAELKALGYTEDKAEIVLKNANGQMSLLPSIYTSLATENIDIYVPIATPTAQAAKSAITDKPVVFSAVSDPLSAGLVDAINAPGGNITGVSDSIPVDKTLEFAKQLVPSIKTIGFVYNVGEANSVSNIEKAKKYCDENGITYKEANVAATADLQQAVASIINSVDAFYTPDDNTVASGMNTYAQLALDAKKPIFCGADSMVKEGGLATVGINYVTLGKLTAKMVDKILKGAKPAETAVEYVTDYAKVINTDVSKALNITLPANAEEFIAVTRENSN